jgi:hypothetical protein
MYILLYFLSYVSSGILRFLNSFLYTVYINIVQVLSFFYTTPPICDLPLVWLVFCNIASFVLGLYSTCEREHVAFGLLSLANFT